eukprot:gnl/Chilomastix_caulleri/699.p1 GENE.gnl/Chilomastix_caulleri/699~~gnl/Chilomastix_caulleri/699.p1  ORF type:complete len:289 (+),score=51.53 gnl/Chilomastix_caulleri/699:67-933(+)
MAELRTIAEIGVNGEDRIHSVDIDRCEEHMVVTKDDGTVRILNIAEGEVNTEKGITLVEYDFPAQGALWFPPEYGKCILSWDLNGTMSVHGKHPENDEWKELYRRDLDSIPLSASIYDHDGFVLKIYISTSNGIIYEFTRDGANSFVVSEFAKLDAPAESISTSMSLLACAKRDGTLQLFSVATKTSVAILPFDSPLTCCNLALTGVIAIGTSDGDTFTSLLTGDPRTSINFSDPRKVTTLLTSNSSEESKRISEAAKYSVVGLSWSELGTELTVDYSNGSVAIFALD